MIHEPCVILRPERIILHPTARVDAFCKLEGGQGLSIGKHVHIASFSHLNVGGGRLIFGDHSGTSSHVVIASGQPDLSYLHISAVDPPEHRHPIRRETVIGRHVVIFAGAIILPGVTVGDGAVVAAGAVVRHDVPAYTIVAGVPAKPIGVRPLALRPHDFARLDYGDSQAALYAAMAADSIE